MTSETGRLRVYGPTRWTSLRGRSTGIPFVARRGCGRGDSFGRPAGATAIDRGRPFGDNPTSVARSQTGPKHPAFPSRSGEGTPKRFGPPGETSSASWAARRAAASGNGSIQSPREHRAVVRRQRRTNATDSSVEQSPEVESGAARRGDTQASATRTARGHAQPVNATASERTWRGDGMVEAAEEGNASKGLRHRGRLPRTFGSTTFGSAARLRGRAREFRNLANPMVGCGVQQTRGPSNEWVFGPARCGRNR
jgi:hypothetical protein